GRPVEYTRFGKTAIEMMKHHMGSNHGAVMKDDESRSEPFLLSRWVDLTLSGKYEVVVSRRVADAPENEFKYRVESNRLTFEIRD
ncbi:MAG: hypothetical protein ACREJC_15165, partial [Tepidisphaeraceae bacterium]